MTCIGLKRKTALVNTQCELAQLLMTPDGRANRDPSYDTRLKLNSAVLIERR
jgi:hypothetical protein